MIIMTLKIIYMFQLTQSDLVINIAIHEQIHSYSPLTNNPLKEPFQQPP